MSENLAKFVKSKQDKARDDRKESGIDELSPTEQRALDKTKTEAEKAGATLDPAYSEGGGLPPSLVLGVMRRDKFTCKVHGDKGEGDYGGLQVHHKGGIIESEWLSKKGHSNDPNNIVTLCKQAHDEIHTKARKEGVDSSQVEAKGDKGDVGDQHVG